MFRPTAEYRSDKSDNYSSGLHCRVIKIQHQTERLCLSRHLVQPTALIATQHHNTYLQLGPMQFSQAAHKSNKVIGTICSVVQTEHQTEQVRLSRHFI